MRIINTFISDPGVKIPEYTIYSLQKLRGLNPDTDIDFICNTGHGFDGVFDKLNVNWINQNSLNSFYLESFRNLSHLDKHGTPNTKYPSPPKFFHRALERIFMLHAYIEKENLNEVYHTENDVLTYYPLDQIVLRCDFPESASIYITPMGPKICTFAMCHFCDSYDLTMLCSKFLEYLWIGEKEFLKLTGSDMLNEMTMLRQATRELYINELPIVPQEIIYMDGFLFDPGSYGQYLGGTNNHDHGPGYAGDHHYIGKLINNKEIVPIFEGGKPYVISDDKKVPIFNLHIHSKNLKDFL